MSYPSWPIPQDPLSSTTADATTAIPAAGIDPDENYRVLRVDKDGYAIIHPDLLARLGNIESALSMIIQRVVENNARRP